MYTTYGAAEMGGGIDAEYALPYFAIVVAESEGSRAVMDGMRRVGHSTRKSLQQHDLKSLNMFG